MILRLDCWSSMLKLQMSQRDDRADSATKGVRNKVLRLGKILEIRHACNARIRAVWQSHDDDHFPPADVVYSSLPVMMVAKIFILFPPMADDSSYSYIFNYLLCTCSVVYVVNQTRTWNLLLFCRLIGILFASSGACRRMASRVSPLCTEKERALK